MPDTLPDTAPPKAEAGGDQSPADRLKELQERLKTQEGELATRSKERDALKADVDSLAKGVGEIDNAKAGYAKNFPQLRDERQKLDKYKDDTLKGTEVLLGPKKEKVDGKIREVEKKITDLKTDVAKTRELVTKTAEESKAAQADLEKKQKEYDGFKNLEKDIGDKLKKLNDFKTKIDKLNDVPKAASMYVLLREMSLILAVTNVPTEKEFEDGLNTRLTALEEAKETVDTKKQAAEDAKAQLTTQEAALAALEKSRVDDLIAATEEFNQ
jgi:chromosome segregation ATPase